MNMSRSASLRYSGEGRGIFMDVNGCERNPTAGGTEGAEGGAKGKKRKWKANGEAERMRQKGKVKWKARGGPGKKRRKVQIEV